MADKTRLELDIEQRERYRTPVSVIIVIVLLLIAICLGGLYTYDLKRQLVKAEQDASVMKENFKKEKLELLKQIKRFQAEHKKINSKSQAPNNK
jgi:hypothetical protein